MLPKLCIALLLIATTVYAHSDKDAPPDNIRNCRVAYSIKETHGFLYGPWMTSNEAFQQIKDAELKETIIRSKVGDELGDTVITRTLNCAIAFAPKK